MTHSGGKPHAVGDRGQRYEVVFLGWSEHPDKEKTLGWADTVEGAQDFVRGIEAHPVWHSPRIIDRHAESPDVPRNWLSMDSATVDQVLAIGRARGATAGPWQAAPDLISEGLFEVLPPESTDPTVRPVRITEAGRAALAKLKEKS